MDERRPMALRDIVEQVCLSSPLSSFLYSLLYNPYLIDIVEQLTLPSPLSPLDRPLDRPVDPLDHPLLTQLVPRGAGAVISYGSACLDHPYRLYLTQSVLVGQVRPPLDPSGKAASSPVGTHIQAPQPAPLDRWRRRRYGSDITRVTPWDPPYYI